VPPAPRPPPPVPSGGPQADPLPGAPGMRSTPREAKGSQPVFGQVRWKAWLSLWPRVGGGPAQQLVGRRFASVPSPSSTSRGSQPSPGAAKKGPQVQPVQLLAVLGLHGLIEVGVNMAQKKDRVNFRKM